MDTKDTKDRPFKRFTGLRATAADYLADADVAAVIGAPRNALKPR
jgi:hypothetical protein